MKLLVLILCILAGYLVTGDPTVEGGDVGVECPSAVVCLSKTTFTFCSIVNGTKILQNTTYSCPSGFACTTNSVQPCEQSATTTTTTTTTTKPTTTTKTTTTRKPTTTSTTTTTTTTKKPTTTTTKKPTTTTTKKPTTTKTTTTSQSPATTPQCTSGTKYPGPQCNQYYQCVFVMWWYDTKLMTCPTGQAFNPSTSACQDSKQLGCNLP